jgi:hypothetical protein
MKTSKKELIAAFRRDCPNQELNDTWSDEGLSVVFDIMEEESLGDEDGFVFTPESVCTYYCEESYTECIESLKIKVDLTQAQSEEEQLTLMENTLKEYLEARGAFVCFTKARRIVSEVEVMQETLAEYMAIFD